MKECKQKIKFKNGKKNTSVISAVHTLQKDMDGVDFSGRDLCSLLLPSFSTSLSLDLLVLSQNHRMAGIGKDLWVHLIHSEQDAPWPLMAFEDLQMERFYTFWASCARVQPSSQGRNIFWCLEGICFVWDCDPSLDYLACPCLSCTAKIRKGHSTPCMASLVLGRGKRSPPLTS